MLSLYDSAFGGANSFVGVYLGDGLGSLNFSSTYSIATTDNPQEAYLEDITGDGILDIIVGTSDGAYVVEGGVGGSFSKTSTLASGNIVGIGSGDFNEDGVPDILLGLGSGVFGGPTASSRVYLAKTKIQSALSHFDIVDEVKAQELINIIDISLEKLYQKQNEIGALLNRLDFSVNANLLYSDSIEEARSLISNTDVAPETAELVKLQILEQIQVSVLSQNNLRKQNVLSLLENLSL